MMLIDVEDASAKLQSFHLIVSWNDACVNDACVLNVTTITCNVDEKILPFHKPNSISRRSHGQKYSVTSMA